VENPFSAALHRAVADASRSRGAAVLAASLDETPERERELVVAFSARRLDGLVIMPAATDQSHLALERSAGVALVFVDRSPSGFGAHSVVADNTAGAEAGTRHLIGVGHHRIAFLGDRSTVVTMRERRERFAVAMRAAGLAVPARLVVVDLDTSAAADSAVLALLDSPDPPAALFTGQNLITIGGRDPATRRGGPAFGPTGPS
jgi:LacI family transcriptional regulator